MRGAPDPPKGLTAVDPREWTRAWARVMAMPATKCTGYSLLCWADYRTGAGIRPGVRLIMRATGIRSETTVGAALRQMREWGLIWRYVEGSKSGRKGDEDEYRLTFPDDITVIPMWSPDWEGPVDNLRSSSLSDGVPGPGPRGSPPLSDGVPGYPHPLSDDVPQAAPLTRVLTHTRRP